MVDDPLHEDNESSESLNRRDINRFMLRRAQHISEKWGKRLDHFELPCPLCKGELKFQGVYHDHLYEFAEGEPGVVNELDVLPISFVCDHCGYTAEFDSDLFNPALLATLQGADPDRINELAVRDFSVLISLTGREESDTLLELATSIAEVQGGTALVFSTSRDEAEELMLHKRLQQFRPQAGAPAPVRLAQHKYTNLSEELAEVIEREECDLLLIDVRDGLGYSQTAAGDTIKRVLKKSLSDVVLVHNRGLPQAVRRILLATAGGPNAQTAAQLAVSLASAFNAEIHFFNAASPNDPDAKANGHARISETLHEILIPDNVRLRTRVVVSSDPVQAIVQEATQFELVVIGDSPRDWRGKVPLNSISAKVARNCSATTLIVLGRRSQIQSWIDRLFG